MPTLSSSHAAHLLTRPFRRHKQRYVINPPDEVHNVIYLGNVLTIMAKGDQSIERPLSAIWRSYNTRKRDVPMKLTVTRSGLKVETKQLGVTEYWAHRVTFCFAPSQYPRVFCWVYKHEGKRMKPELRCHAVLCKKHAEPARIVDTLTNYLQAALQEYKREKLTMEKARKNSVTSGGCPRRKLLLQTGTLNFRPPVNRSKSAPRLGSIDEEDEADEQPLMDEGTSMSDFEYDEMSDLESFGFRETPLLGGPASTITNSSDGDRLSQSSASSNSTTSAPSNDGARMGPVGLSSPHSAFLRRQLSLSSTNRRRFAAERAYGSISESAATSMDPDELPEALVLEEDELMAADAELLVGPASTSSVESSAASCASSDDGFASSCQSADFHQSAAIVELTPTTPVISDSTAQPASGDFDSLSDDSACDPNGRRRGLSELRQSAHDLSDENEDPIKGGESTVTQIRRMFAANVQVTAL